MTLLHRLIPDTIQAGLTFSLNLALPDFPASVWDVSLILRGPQSINLVATKDGECHVLSASAAASASWPAGAYWYTIRATDGQIVSEIEGGEVRLLADLAAQSANYDGRSHPQKVLDSINAVIEGRATKDQESYRINNRELRRTSISQLLELKKFYEGQVRAEKSAKSGRSSLGRNIYVRF